MIQVNYWLHSLNPNQIKQWISFEGVDFLIGFAHRFWLKNNGTLPIPETNHEALDRFEELQQPQSIQAKKNENGYFQLIAI